MNKEVLTFVGSLALFGALVAMGGADGSSGDGRRRTRTQEQPVLVAAKPAPGRFIPDAQETWSAEGRNVFIAPSDLKEPPPLELAWPPLRRAALPAPPLPFPAAAASTKALRRPYDVTAAAPTNGGGSGGGEAAAASGSGGETTTPAEPAATSDKPPGTDLSPGARFEKERKRLEAERAEQRRRAGLDSITIAGNDVRYGEFAGSLDRDLSRYEVKRRFDLLRREGGITESERTDRLKKMTLVFYEIAKTGKKGRRQTHTADTVTEIKFADTPVNRYQERRLEAAPADLDAQLELIASLMPEREWKLASDDLQTLRARGRTSPKLYELLADALHEQFAYEAALEALREGVAKHPEAVGLYARLGRTLNVMGLRSEAIEAFRKALEKNPSDHVANAGLGEALLRDGKPGPALAALREAVNATNVDPMSVESARIWLARAALASGDVRNAEAAVGLVLQRFKAGEDLSAAPPARRALHRRATAVASVVALLQGQAAEARRFAEEGVRAHPEDGVLRFALGMVALHENRLDEARRLLEEAPSFDPLLTARCKAALAFVHELSGRDGDAATTAEQAALVADPSDAALRAPFGRALLNAGDAARAREQLLVALEAQP
ncbi:MAG TPA: tetratricopeptide repeat protein, partial [Planctomycetota bacterium]|nr:tetratricopeptide repeat protein [Planctomycetota bacterium]